MMESIQRAKPSPSARTFLRHLKKQKSLTISFASGIGTDEALFAQDGHRVIASDLNRAKLKVANRQIGSQRAVALSLNQELPFQDNSFDAVYIRLGLHYFSNEELPEIISEISRILKPKGLVYIVVKSRQDFYYQQFKETRRPDGMVSCTDPRTDLSYLRNFFSTDQLRALLEKTFKIIATHSHNEQLYEDSHTSSLITLVAKRRA